jgi:predicted metal-dependent phosphoesterase TrpH
MSAPIWIKGHHRLDLHLHSNLSDGRLSPQDLLTACSKAGLDCIALTDHDLAPALPAGRNFVDKKLIHVIHAVELSGHHENRELHLLVYFPSEMPPSFRTFCQSRAIDRAARYERARKMLDMPSIPPADETAQKGERALTRLHLARAMVESGDAKDTQDAFDRWLSKNPSLFPQIQLSFIEAIQKAREAGGICAWAHPRWEEAERWTEEFAQAGLHALEGLRPSVKKKGRKRFEKLAQRNGLFLTGGSDWHGWRREELGNFNINGEQAEAFLNALAVA